MKKTITQLIATFIILLSMLSCSQKSGWDTQLDWERLNIHTLPTAADYPDYGAIVLHDEAKILNYGDEDDGWSLYNRHRIVKIFDIRGHQYANIAIPYSPRNEISDLQARTILSTGQIKVVNTDNIYDISLYPNYMLYSDQKSKIFTFPAIENECIVEYRYSIRYEGHNYGNSWSFQDNIPVLYSRFEIQIPDNAQPTYKISGIDLEPIVKKAPEGFKSKYIWEASNLSAVEPEIAMPVRKNAIATLKISSNQLKTWKEIADWYNRLSKPRMTTSEEMKNLVTSLTKGMVDNSKKLKAIYDWVIKNIRYISVSIGIGSYQPHSANEVLDNRYGDCKDMTNLLCTMAKEANVDIYPAIISTWQNGEIDTTIVSVSQFNHVIAYYPIIGDSGIWMDATDQACKFNSLPWYDQGRYVLTIMGDSSKFIQTPKVNYLSNRNTTHWKVDLKDDGSAFIEAENRIWGAQANDLRFTLLMQSEKDKIDWLENLVEDKCLFSILDTMSVSGQNPIKDPLTIRYTFLTEKFADLIKKELIFQPGNFSNMNLSDYFDEEKRKYPVKFKYGMQQQFNLEIILPENWLVKTEDVDKRIQSDFGEASWRWYTAQNILYIQNQFILKGDDIQAENYPQFKSFLKEIRLQERKSILLSNRSQE